MRLFRRKPAMEQSTSEHLVAALRTFQERLRRAGAGQAPDEAERAVLGELHTKLHQLSHEGDLSPELREALRDTAATLARLLEPRRDRILDWTPGGP